MESYNVQAITYKIKWYIEGTQIKQVQVHSVDAKKWLQKDS